MIVPERRALPRLLREDLLCICPHCRSTSIKCTAEQKLLSVGSQYRTVCQQPWITVESYYVFGKGFPASEGWSGGVLNLEVFPAVD